MFDLLIPNIRAAVTKNISGRKRRKRSFDNQGILKVFAMPIVATVVMPTNDTLIYILKTFNYMEGSYQYDGSTIPNDG